MDQHNLKGGIEKLGRDLDTPQRKKGIVREYVEALLVAIVLAFVIRSFVVEPYKIPSKSMVPTLLVGDHIFVNKFIYGLRIPGTKKWIYKGRDPKRGQVIVFIYPEDEKLDFIKRVVGLPGDLLRIQQGHLTINGREPEVKDVQIAGIDPQNKRKLLLPSAYASSVPHDLSKIPYYLGFENYQIQIEDLFGVEHFIQRSRLMPDSGDLEITVPAGHFFVMGDNRDQSADSRVWGFVPRENLKGEALFIWLSLDSDLGGIRLGRFGRTII